MLDLAGQGVCAGDGSDELSEAVDLVEDNVAHLGDVVDDLEVEVECGWAVGLVRGIVPDVQVWVLESLLHTDAGRWIEREHLVEEVESVGVGLREQGWEGLLWHEWKVADVFLRTGGADSRKSLFVGSAEDVQNLVQLVDVVAALEEGSATEEFSQDTADRPDIN